MANDATVTIHGNLVRDPELREIGVNKTKVAAFTVAVSTNNKKPDGTYDANFYDVSLWAPRAESFMQRAQKGTAVQVVGDLSLSDYVSKTDGQKHYRLRIDAYKVKITARAKQADAPQIPAAPVVEEADPFN